MSFGIIVTKHWVRAYLFSLRNFCGLGCRHGNVLSFNSAVTDNTLRDPKPHKRRNLGCGNRTLIHSLWVYYARCKLTSKFYLSHFISGASGCGRRRRACAPGGPLRRGSSCSRGRRPGERAARAHGGEAGALRVPGPVAAGWGLPNHSGNSPFSLSRTF